MKERTAARNAPRFSISLEADLFVGSGSGAQGFPVITCDLGAGGASIESPEPVDAGAAVTLQLTLAGAAEEAPRLIRLPATVTRAEGANPCRLALTFVGAHPKTIEALKRFILRARDHAHR